MSSKKFLLIDEIKYNNLLKNYDPDHLNIAKKDVDDIFQRDDLNVSARNALYNNSIKKLIKKLKAADEKPVNMSSKKLESTLETLTNLISNPTPLPPSPLPPAKVNVKQQKRSYTPQQKSSYIPPQKRSLSYTPQQKFSPSSFTTPPSFTIPNIPQTPQKQNPRLSPIPTPTVKPPRRNSNKTSNKLAKIQEAENYLLQNADKYRLNAEGKVLNKNNEPLDDSNVRSLAEYIVGGSVGNQTPPGFKYIKSIVSGDPELQKMRNDPKVGRGAPYKRIKNTIKNTNQVKTHKIKPVKWLKI